MRYVGHQGAQLRSATARRVAGTLLAALILLFVYLVVRLTGGTPNPLVHIAYLGIIVAAVSAGPLGGVLAGLVSGLMLGPLMPDSTARSATLLAQWGWAIRLAVYVLAGLLVAVAWSWAQRMGRIEAARAVVREILNLAGREKTSLAACRRLLAELARWRPTLAAAVYVLESGDTAYLLAGWQASGLEIRRRERLHGAAAAILRRTAGGDLHRRPLRAELLRPEAGDDLAQRGARSELVVPLRLDGRPIGVLFLIGPGPASALDAIERVALAELAEGTAAIVRRAQQEEDSASRRAAELVRPILDQPQLLDPVFQPIQSLTGGGVAGYEALARFRAEPAEPPNVWFERAALAGLGAELQALAIRRAREVAEAERLPAGSFMSVNVSPGLLGDTFVREALAGDLRRVVIELTEEEAIGDYPSLRSVLAEYRARGARYAIDDAGAGYASLRHVTELRPDFIKLDARLIIGLAGDDGRQALVRAMQIFAHDIGATLIAEGVETEQELALLQQTALPILVQGYAVAHPREPWASGVPRRIAASRAEEVDPARRRLPARFHAPG